MPEPLTQSPRVSWCIAAKDAEQTLGPVLRAILDQDFSDFEVLVIDDGSADRTAALAQESHDDRVRVISLPVTRGRGAARNVALGQARGEYFAINDADDISLPDRLTLQVQYLDAHPSIAAVGAHMINVDRGSVSEHLMPWPTTPEAARAAASRGRMPLAHAASVFRTSVLRDLGGYSSECVRAQDYELVLRLLARWDVANLPEAVLHYARPRNPPLGYWMENFRYHRFAEKRAAAVNSGQAPPAFHEFASAHRRLGWTLVDAGRWLAMRSAHAIRGVS